MEGVVPDVEETGGGVESEEDGEGSHDVRDEGPVVEAVHSYLHGVRVVTVHLEHLHQPQGCNKQQLVEIVSRKTALKQLITHRDKMNHRECGKSVEN